MSIFNKIYDKMKQFFIYLSCRTHPDYVSLNHYDNDDMDKVKFHLQ